MCVEEYIRPRGSPQRVPHSTKESRRGVLVLVKQTDGIQRIERGVVMAALNVDLEQVQTLVPEGE